LPLEIEPAAAAENEEPLELAVPLPVRKPAPLAPRTRATTPPAMPAFARPAVTTALRTPERDAYASFLPYAYLQYDLILAEPAGRHYASLSDFVARGTGRLNVTRGMAYDAAVETQLALLAAAGRLEVVSDFETVFGKLEMGRADGTLATPPIYARHLKARRFKAPLSVIPLLESTARFTGVYLSKKTLGADLRGRYAAAVKAMVADQVVPVLYARYFDDATVKRIFRQGPAPLLEALASPD